MTKKKIAWITDSTAYITEELSNHPDVYVIPLSIIFGDHAYEDGVDLTADELYQKINASKQIPKTSQPPVGRFVELYEKLKEEYESAIAIHISSKLSGTMEGSRSAARMAEFPVEVVDSKCMSYPITNLLLKGITWAEQGKEYKEIAEKLRREASKSENYILLGSLDQFYKGGRMSGTQYLLGNLLQIKPIIRINRDGEFELFEKVRSEKKAVKRIMELFQQSFETYQIRSLQVMHGNVPDKANEWRQNIKAQFPNLEVVVGTISSTIGVHAGEGTIALTWTNENEGENK